MKASHYRRWVALKKKKNTRKQRVLKEKGELRGFFDTVYSLRGPGE